MFRLKSPLSAQLELTDACNNACLHCYNYWQYTETGKRIGFDPRRRTLEHFQQLLNSLCVNEVRTVTFTGGEPFLRRDILFDLIVIAKEAGVDTGINTNGALITTDDIKHLKDVGVDFLLVSLLSNNSAIHNMIVNSHSHSLTSRAIINLVEADLRVAANMVVSTHNWQGVRQTAMYAKDIGLNEFAATPVLPCPLAKGHLELSLKSEQVKTILNDLLWVREQGMMVDVLEPIAHCMFDQEERIRFAQFLSHRSCSAGISDIVISPDGDVRPCILATQSYGNLIADGWQKCWDNLAIWGSPDLLPCDCLDCDLVDECGGGCRIAALAVSGSINGKDPYMTNPLTDSGITKIDNDTIQKIDSKTVITFPSSVSIRSEEFGCVLFRGRSFMFLDRDGAQFVQYLKGHEFFTVESVIEDLDINESSLLEFLGALVNRDFLTIHPSKERGCNEDETETVS